MDNVSCSFSSGDGKTELIRKILNNKLIFSSFWVNISSNCKMLIRKMLSKNPETRITIDEIVTHHWIDKVRIIII